MSLADLPALAALSKDLASLESRLAARDAIDSGRNARVVEGRDVARVEVPWAGGVYWLSVPQGRVVRALAEALATRNPEVEQGALLRLSGAGRGVRRLADLFAGHAAWGRLVVPGRAANTFRLPEPPEDPADDEVYTVPVED